jgi:arylsulfatase A-like enzyme
VSSSPNILVILTDQQRYDAVGFAGNPSIQTPNLDRLAQDALHFSHAFCPYPVCTPSRYSFLTGLPVRAHGGWSNRCTLAPGIETFPRRLRRAGYRTEAIGKMHFTPTRLDVGFDRLELSEQDGDGRFEDDYHRDLRDHGLFDLEDIVDQRREYRSRADSDYWETFGAQASNLPEAWHSTTWIGDRAVRRLEKWGSGGNLLMAGFIKPHHPFDPPAPWDRMYNPERLNPPPGWTDEILPMDESHRAGYFPNDRLTRDSLRRVLAHYYATISHVDHQVGRMIETLKSRGLYDDTLIVFASDHGEYMGYHHLLLKGGPMYEPLVRVPLLVKLPGSEAGGERRDTLASLLDVAPMLLHRAGIEPSPGMGRPDLTERSRVREWVFTEDRGGRALMARSRSHKLILSSEPGHSRFFALETDPYEREDRIDDPSLQSEIARHRDALAHWAMHEALPPTYLDTSAPAIPDAGIRSGEYGTESMRDYFERKFSESRNTFSGEPSSAID